MDSTDLVTLKFANGEKFKMDVTSFTVDLLFVKGFCECEQLYLHAIKILADKQGAVLGKYIRGAELHNGRSYYWKTTPTKTFYVLFDSDGRHINYKILS